MTVKIKYKHCVSNKYGPEFLENSLPWAQNRQIMQFAKD